MSKILIAAMNYTPEMTGCGKYTGDFGAEMARRGHLVEVVTCVPHYPGWQVRKPYMNSYTKGQCDGAFVYRCPVFLPSAMRGIWRFLTPLSFAITSAPVTLWRAFALRPDTIMMVEPTLFIAPLGLLIAKIVGARTVLHVQDLEVDAAFSVGHLPAHRWLKKLGGLFERVCLQKFDKIVTISFKMAEKIGEKGVDKERLSVVRNWVDLDHIRPVDISYSYREQLGLPRDAFVVLYSGNIGPKQGLDVIIQAARILHSVPSLLFVLAGEGPSKTELEKRSSGLRNIRFLPFQPYDTLGEFLGLCNLHLLTQISSAGDLVLPSKLGGMLASGRPIIVTAEPETELADYLQGVATVVPTENAAALAEAIHMIFISGADRSYSAQGLRLAQELSRPAAMNRLEDALTL